MVLQTLLSILLVGLFQLPLVALQNAAAGGALSGLAGGTGLTALNIIGVMLAILLSLAIAARFLDRRRFADFGLHFSGGWWADFGFGLALGAGLMALIFAFELAAGWVSVTVIWMPAGSRSGQKSGCRCWFSSAWASRKR